jgi:hypothetical protein
MITKTMKYQRQQRERKEVHVHERWEAVTTGCGEECNTKGVQDLAIRGL